jgi:hypothetical protein
MVFTCDGTKRSNSHIDKVNLFLPLILVLANYKLGITMTELFRDQFGVSVARVGQSYQKPYNHRLDTVPYPQGTRIPEFSKFSSENGRSTHEHIG